MVRNFTIFLLAFGLIAACDSSDKAAEQKSTAEQGYGDAKVAAGEMLDAAHSATADAVDSTVDNTKEIANNAKDASAEAWESTKTATSDTIDSVSDSATDAYNNTAADADSAMDEADKKAQESLDKLSN
ncbi:hypothetical protein FR932_08640 [Moritella marina ATCC 15381]|uniref:Uncharacterized protein n=1 Tax=Moritella marina ATCC 15381 TaxID=1202962 RepID=A0A5J6WMA6_MORMI|nr:hypothetical protein [Moritella marina]QFI37915.1 hypothetical protein FR932_08640 [Moritella marina ATCC 15381]